MSAMERRLQILLDQHRYALLSAESEQTGRSVGSIIRDAIDLRYSPGRYDYAEAVEVFLAWDQHEPGREPDWAETKAELERDLLRGTAP